MNAPIFKPRVRCVVCAHDERIRIEALHCAGQTLDKLSEQFGMSRDAIHRHCRNHMTGAAKASYLLGGAKVADLANQAATEARSVLDYLSICRSIVMNQLDLAAQGNRPNDVDRLAGRLVDILREIGRITGEVSRIASATFNITNNTQILNSPLFAELQAGLLEVCASHPEARADIIALFQALDQRHAPRPALIEGAAIQ